MRIVMMGTGTFAEPSFRALLQAGEQVVGLVTQPDRGGAKARGSTRQTGQGMATIAQLANLPVVQPANINTPEGIAALEALQPDLLVVAAYGQILKPSVLAVPNRGAINVHASLLPKYRGASPVAAAILAGETQTGVTIIRITPGLDAGNMLLQETLAIGPEETTGELEARLAELGARLCLAAVQQLKQGEVAGQLQDPSAVTRAPKFSKEQGLIDWQQPAMQLQRHIRAMQPWPTAYTFYHRPGKPVMRLVVSTVTPTEATPEEAKAQPGSVLHQRGKKIFAVKCGSNTVLLLREVIPAGKQRMTAEAFLNGYPALDGTTVGSEGTV